MSELQQLYQLQKALQVKIVSRNELEKIEAPYERRKKNCREATTLKHAEIALREAREFDAKKKRMLWNAWMFFAGIMILIGMLALTYLHIKQVYINHDLATITGLGLPEFLGVYYVFVGATMLLVCAPWNIELPSTSFSQSFRFSFSTLFKNFNKLTSDEKIRTVLSLFWIIIALVSYIGVTIYCFSAYEDFWMMISGLILPIYPVLIVIVLVFQFFGSLFSGDWELFLFNTSTTLPPYLLLVLGAITIWVVMKYVGRGIESTVSKKDFSKKDEILACEKKVEIAKKELKGAEQKIDNERDQNPQYINFFNIQYQASNAVDCSSVVAESDKDLNTVTSIIWCFEQHYADSVKEAKQWLAQQAHYRDVQNQLRSIHREVQKTNSTLDVMNMKLDDIGVQLDKIYEAIPSSVDVTVEVRNEITFS